MKKSEELRQAVEVFEEGALEGLRAFQRVRETDLTKAQEFLEASKNFIEMANAFAPALERALRAEAENRIG